MISNILLGDEELDTLGVYLILMNGGCIYWFNYSSSIILSVDSSFRDIFITVISLLVFTKFVLNVLFYDSFYFINVCSYGVLLVYICYGDANSS